MKKATLFIIVVAALILAACGAAATQAPAFDSRSGVPAQQPPAEGYSQEMPLPAAPTLAPAATAMPSNMGGGGNVSAANVERVVIQNADLTVVVPDVEKRMKEIEAMAKKMNGFVVSSNLYQSYARNNIQVPEATVVIRVPAEKLDEVLDLIKKDAVEVQNENRSGEDVTNQYVDLQSQLKAKQAAEEQLLKIMQNAEKTEDVLAVYQQLQMIQTVQPIEVAGWKPQGVARDAIQDLVRFMQNFADFMIGFFLRDLWELLLIALPFYIVFLIGRAVYRRIRASRPKKEIAPPPVETQ